MAGSVWSGCVESGVHELIQQVLQGGEPRLVEYKTSDEKAGEVGLSCGGQIDVLVAPYEPGEVWSGLEGTVAGQRRGTGDGPV